MDLLHVKALHIIFVVSWFAGLFYIVRLFIYHTEALQKGEPERGILHRQFIIMERRLTNIIMTPAMILTIIFGGWMIYLNPVYLEMTWMWVKIGLVILLIGYHHFCNKIRKDLKAEKISMSSTKLRFFNEIATLLLIGIVFLAVLKSVENAVGGIAALVLLSVVFMIIIKWYKKKRNE